MASTVNRRIHLGRSLTSAAAVIALVMAGLMGLAPASGAASAKSVYVIGNVSNVTEAGAPLAISKDVGPTLVAWSKWVNAHGGINGHHVKVIAKDDQTNSGTALTDVQTLVQNDHVLAIVGDEDANTESSWASYAETAHVPVIGGGSYTATWFTNPAFFPTSTTVITTLYGQAAAAKAAGATSIGYVYNSAQSASAAALPLLQGAAKQLGMKFAWSEGVDTSSPSFAAPCLAAKASGVQSIEVAIDASVTPTFATDCAQQGFHPIWIESEASNVPSLLPVAALQGTIGDLNCFPWFLKAPVLSTFQKAMKKYAPGYDYGCTAGTTWQGLAVFQKVAENLGNNPTPSAVFNALYNLPAGTTLGGLTPALTYVKGKPAPQVRCFYLSGIKNHKFVAPNGLKTSCESLASATALAGG
jgi:branched-chain amino acid transport system substrate-binding protein